MAEPTCWKCGAVIQGAPFDGDPPTMRFCWECAAVGLVRPRDSAMDGVGGTPYCVGDFETVVAEQGIRVLHAEVEDEWFSGPPWDWWLASTEEDDHDR